MTVRVEKDGPVTTIINDRPEARNAVDPETGDALVEAFLEFESGDERNLFANQTLEFLDGYARHYLNPGVSTTFAAIITQVDVYVKVM